MIARLHHAVAAALLASALAAPGGAHAACRFVKVGTLPLDLSGSVPHIDGSINGQPMRAVVATGSTTTHVSRPTAERAQLTLQHTQFVLYGPGGETRAYRALVDDIAFGPIQWKRAGIGVAWDDDGQSSAQAVLAADFLLQADLELVMAERELRFFRPVGCDDAFLAYWDPEAVVLPMPLLGPGDRRAVVEVRLNGKPVRARIDTNRERSLVDLPAALRAGLRVPEGAASRWPGRFDSIDLGDESIRNTQVMVTDIWGSYRRKANDWTSAERIAEQPEMILGMDFLKAHRVLIARSQARLYLSHLGGPVFAVDPQP